MAMSKESRAGTNRGEAATDGVRPSSGAETNSGGPGRNVVSVNAVGNCCGRGQPHSEKSKTMTSTSETDTFAPHFVMMFRKQELTRPAAGLRRRMTRFR